MENNYIIAIDPITNEESNSIRIEKGKREEGYKDFTDLPLIDKATYDKLEAQIKSTKINNPILMGRK